MTDVVLSDLLKLKEEFNNIQTIRKCIIDNVPCVSVFDVICFLSKKENDVSNARTIFWRLKPDHLDVVESCLRFKFPGKNQKDTPVASMNVLFQLLQILPGKLAAKFRISTAKIISQFFDPTPSFID